MGTKTNAAIIDREEIILEDGSNVIFTTAVLSDETQSALPEISEFIPNRVKHIIPVTNGSKNISIIGINGLIDIEKVEYPVDREPKQYRDFKLWGDVIELDIRAAPAASSKGTLTGTLTFTTDSVDVTGSSTLFTTELEVGFYLQTSTGSTWYRIASITDDTNLVLTAVALAADNGADTVDSTKYWFEYAYLYCRKTHYLTILTDLVGAIDLGAGYAAGAVLIHVDALGSGVVTENTILTIVGVPGSYRVIEDVTIGTNECDIKISPGLEGRAPDDAVVNIRPSSLTSQLETLLPELAAGRAALNYVGTARTQINNSFTAIDLANTAYDLVAARITNGVAHIASGAGEVTDKRTDASTALDLAPAKIASALTALINAVALIDTVPVGDNPVGQYLSESVGQLRAAASEVTLANGILNLHSTAGGYSGLAGREFQAASIKIAEGQGYISESIARARSANALLGGLQVWAVRKVETTLQSLRRKAVPKQKYYGYSRS